MATFYVRKSGNDTTGNGSSAAPWLTLSKAQATIASGDTVNIGPGTYQEDTSGTGYFFINIQFTTWTTFQSETNDPADVIVQGATNGTNNVRTGAANSFYRFRNLTFRPRLETNTAACRVELTTAMAFENCRFTAPQSAAALRYAFQLMPSGATAANNVTLTDCTFDGGANTNGYGVFIDTTAAGSTVDVAVFTNCTATGVQAALAANGAITNVDINGGSYVGGALYGIRIGVDGETALGTSTGQIRNAMVSTATGHGVLLGAGASTYTVSSCRIGGGDYGLVMKESADHVITANRIGGGKNSATIGTALYFKAANGCTVTANLLSTARGTNPVVRVGAGDTANTSGTITLTGNRMIAYGVPVYAWADGTGDSGGCVVNSNVYKLLGAGATFGDIGATTGITTLAGLKAAWDAYGDGTNDESSTTSTGSADRRAVSEVDYVAALKQSMPTAQDVTTLFTKDLANQRASNPADLTTALIRGYLG